MCSIVAKIYVNTAYRQFVEEWYHKLTLLHNKTISLESSVPNTWHLIHVFSRLQVKFLLTRLVAVAYLERSKLFSSKPQQIIVVTINK